MSMHYSKYANDAFRVEYIGRKPRNDCIKTIQVEWGDERIDFLLFSPDGTRILSNLEQGVCVWDATSGELLAGPLAGSNETRVLSATYLPDGRYIISVSGNGIIKKWDVLTICLVWERIMVERQIDSTWMTSAVFSPDRKSVVFGDKQGIIQIRNVDTGEQDGEPLEGPIGIVDHLSSSSDSRNLASGSSYTTILIWDMDKRELKAGLVNEYAYEMTVITLSPNGNNVVSSSGEGYIYVLDVDSGKTLRKIKCVNKVSSVIYSPNGLFLLACRLGWIRMWNIADNTAEGKVLKAAGRIQWISFSPDGSRFVSGSYWMALLREVNGVIQIWNSSWSVEEAKSTFEERVWISSIILSPEGKFIASGSERSNEGSIYSWTALTGKLVKLLEFISRVESLSFSPVNEQLITFGSQDGTVQVWDVTNDESIKIRNIQNRVSSVVFSPSDGTHLASGS